MERKEILLNFLVSEKLFEKILMPQKFGSDIAQTLLGGKGGGREDLCAPASVVSVCVHRIASKHRLCV